MASGWQPVEKKVYYAVSGTTGPELYTSIGERGPQIGDGMRTIAYTDFKLTWTRDYQQRGDACVLASARPKLIITYNLPKASKKLIGMTRTLWESFADGVAAHEKIHGQMIVDMVHEIERQTVGLTVENDPGCRKIRTEMTKILGPISNARQQKNRDFDRVELTQGGSVHQLVLALVNGGR
nr:DUF922 domain-containing protein [Pararhizobium capsulatum]